MESIKPILEFKKTCVSYTKQTMAVKYVSATIERKTITAIMGQAKRISSKSMFMYLGELVEYGDTEVMFSNPNDERTKAYLTGKMG